MSKLLDFRRVLIPLGTVLTLLGIHEFGHVWASWITGGRIADIAILSLTPHVRVLGAGTGPQEAFRAAAGSASSLLACLAFLVFHRGRSLGWRLAHISALVFGGVELAGWSLSAALTNSPSRDPDDAARFLSASGFGAVDVLSVCLAIAVIGFMAFLMAQRERYSPARTVQRPEPLAKAAAPGE
jgi:hypothetical protein